MGKTFRRLLSAAAGTAAAWALAVKPRTSGKPDMSEFRKYDFAHRGYFNIRKKIPENSMKAFAAAVEHGYGIELDVRLTRDGIPVVIHDSRLLRLCGADGCVEDKTREELREYRLSKTEEGIPDLEEVLALVDGQVPVLLDIKTDLENYGVLCSRISQVLDGYDGVFAVQSADPMTVRWFRGNRPEYIRGQVMEYGERCGCGIACTVGSFLRHNLLTNFLTTPDFVTCNVEDRKNLSLRLCRFLYRVQTMEWGIHDLEGYELVKTDESLVIFEEIEP